MGPESHTAREPQGLSTLPALFTNTQTSTTMVEEKAYFSHKSSASLTWRLVKYTLAILAALVVLSRLPHLPVISVLDDNHHPVKSVLSALDNNLAGNWSEKYTAEAHLPGTNYGLVEFTRAKFAEYGLKTEVDTYDVYVSYPESHHLHLLDANDSIVYKAPLREDEIPEDSTSFGDGLVPTFLSYAANGNVTAQFVYANYASKQDFEYLAEKGVNVSGKIVVARYGGIFRGLKVKFAQDHGAVGVLLFTDPSEDFGITPANGYKQYPHGPARHESAVQRGSVQFLGGVGAAPGDPTTPGYASKGDVERKDPHASIGKIPALPISYREVVPILRQLNGHGLKSPKEWHGELDGINYDIGPNPSASLNLYSNQTFKVTPLWNVYGKIEGEKKDEVVILGNHRDAWIKGGAGDPNSGSAVLIEVARALGALQKSGYKFKRTIILQSYDGEEYGLLGSTEFGEYAASKLQKKVVAYLNVDVAVSGKRLHLGASPLLNKLLKKVARWVPYPEEGVGLLYDHHAEKSGGIIGNLGSGSDYTVFLEHLGIPSADIGFGGTKGDAVYQYHSNYDSYHWMAQFGDKGFKYHNTMSKYLSLLLLELSKHEVIEFSLKDYANDLRKYFEQVKHLVPHAWWDKPISEKAAVDYLSLDDEHEEYMADVSNGVYEAREFLPFKELLRLYNCPHMEHMLMLNADHHKELTFGDVIQHTEAQLIKLQEEGAVFDVKSDELQTEFDNRGDLSWWRRIKLHFDIRHHNKLAQYYERNFLFFHGLHERSWFKHIVFAAGRFTGYGGQTWPGIREAIEDDDIDRTVKWLGIAAKAARKAASVLLHA